MRPSPSESVILHPPDLLSVQTRKVSDLWFTCYTVLCLILMRSLLHQSYLFLQVSSF